MAETTYKVKKGDTLWDIAGTVYGDNTLWPKIAEYQVPPIKSPYVIQPGQVLKIPSVSGAGLTSANANSRPIVEFVGIQSGTSNVLYATWRWDWKNTASYEVVWYYYAGNKWFEGSSSTNTVDSTRPSYAKISTYTIPDNAVRVKVNVKAVSEKKKVKNGDTETEVDYWTSSWSTDSTISTVYVSSVIVPNPPSGLQLTIDENLNAKATIDGVDSTIANIQIEFVKNDTTIVKTTGKIAAKTSHAEFTFKVATGAQYKARCRGYNSDGVVGEWSDYTSNVQSEPAAPSAITTYRARSETEVELEWSAVTGAESYDIEYTEDIKYFDVSSQVQSSTALMTRYIITDLTTGKQYYFRVRAVIGSTKSNWSKIVTVILGKRPSPPTTWSSTTTAVVGEPVTVFWIHNSEDESEIKNAKLSYTIGGTTTEKDFTYSDQDDNDDSKSFTFDSTVMSSLREGATITWKVKTAGIKLLQNGNPDYSDWSIERTIDIYAKPTIDVDIINSSGDSVLTVESFPFVIATKTTPHTQNPIGYHFAITPTESYETIDEVGNTKVITTGIDIYSKNYDNFDVLWSNTDAAWLFNDTLSASDIDLQNNIEYQLVVTVYMDSGLSATKMITFTVAWEEEEFFPNAEIGINDNTLVAYIRPYCSQITIENGVETESLVENITLSVYRREFDGTFTEIATGLSNTESTYVTDPHPALDFARYRIIAMSNETGAVSFYDVPGVPVNEVAAVIQWDEVWSDFDYSQDNISEEENPWDGSMIKFPYNIDVSDSNDRDVSLVEYIGRKYPVSYHGTQIGSKQSWSMEIPKDDKETLYAIRRLAIWQGDVYVREPSGSGYWANVSVTYSKTHLETTIPISIDITRVEGGM